jgi:trimethylamine--corrinoid protein Co-methyltransferase
MASGTGVGILDALTNQRRESHSGDVETLVKLQHGLDHVDIVRSMVTATDYPPDFSDLVEFYYLFKHTTKPILHRTLRPDNVPIVLEMARAIAGDTPSLREKPIFGVVYCPLSPLSLTGEAFRSMLLYAEQGIPVLILSMAMGGATAPVTLLGELLVINAEVLGTVILIKTLFPRAPLLYGSVSSVLDMKTAILALGAPERGILNLWCARMARYYGMPSVVGGLSTDAGDLDAQDGFEKAVTALPLLGEATVIFGMGVIDSANSYSYEQLILDHEFVGALKKVERGLDRGNGREEVELIKQLGPKKDYLREMHTVTHYREYFRSTLFKKGSSQGKDIVTKANEKWKGVLYNTAPCEPLNDDVDQELIRMLRLKIGTFPH